MKEKIMDPHIIELPDACTGPADELWRVEFWTVDGRHHLGNDASRAAAERFYGSWKAGSSARAKFCRLCPISEDTDCAHDELPEQRGWLYSEMTEVRIMPMREAL